MATKQKMLRLTTEERLALLLTVLGQEATNAALKSINPTRAKFVSKLLDDLKADPPSTEEIDYIAADFSKYFSIALSTLGPEIEAQAALNGNSDRNTPKKEDAKSSGPNVIEFELIENSGDPARDLNQLDPFQIATALSDDHPKTIALVLSYLSTSLAAEVVQELDDETRNTAVVFLSQRSTVPQLVSQKVLATVFDNANAIRYRREVVEQSQVLAELMRSLPKDMRNELIEKLTEEDEELVQEIRSKLYVFEDLHRLDDRDIQKVLGETETDNLIVALQNADAELTALLLGNLSKRARQTIEEEMQYKTGVDESEIQEARGMLVEALGKLDEAGEIKLS